MRYSSMEEAVGQYLAKMLEYSFVEINETPSYGNYNYCDNAITVMTSVERKIIITSKLPLESQLFKNNYFKFGVAMGIIDRIKETHTINSSDMTVLIENEFDEAVMTEILIHAVREKYIKKADVIDSLAQIDKARMIVEFLNETKDIVGKEGFEL